MSAAADERRAEVLAARRIVVKVGSSSLASADAGLDPRAIQSLAHTVARARQRGAEVVLVSSGAIAAGINPLGLRARPRDLATQQAAASVGQGILMASYAAAFADHGLTVGQVLLTVDDVVRRGHYRNALTTMRRLLELGVVPIVNENDTVATHEIRFGDNDRLAALVAQMVRADLLVLLSDVDGLYTDHPDRPNAQQVPIVDHPSQLEAVTVGSAGAAGVGTGGMATKLQAATMATGSGMPVVLTLAGHAGAALRGDPVGTLFRAHAARPATRHAWLAHATTARGSLSLDEGAVVAVRDAHKSVLPAGITTFDGRFEAGDPVDVIAPDGTVVGRGLVNYSAEELPAMIGHSTRHLADRLGAAYARAVIHCDDLVIF